MEVALLIKHIGRKCLVHGIKIKVADWNGEQTQEKQSNSIFIYIRFPV